VNVQKTGLFSAFAHDHTIAAPLASGHLDVQKRTVELKFRSQDMKVLDPGIKDSERDDIDRTMKSYKVLDAGRFPEIVFVSTSVETPAVGAKASGTSAAGADAAKRYLVHGKLTLHGVTRPVELPVSFSEGHYTGKVTLKQTEFGITPVKIAGGTVKVKDAIEIVFEIVPTR
jgi:polyisoprenoid-binding protein YceI